MDAGSGTGTDLSSLDVDNEQPAEGIILRSQLLADLEELQPDRVVPRRPFNACREERCGVVALTGLAPNAKKRRWRRWPG